MKNSVLKALIDDSFDEEGGSGNSANYNSINYEDDNELGNACSENYGDSALKSPKKTPKLDKKRKIQLAVSISVVVLIIVVLLVLNVIIGRKLDDSPADIIILNSVPYSVAIKGNKIQRVGTAPWVEEKYDRKKTKLIDASNHRISSGYVDNGAYLFWGALTKYGNVTILETERTPAEVINTTRGYLETWADKDSSVVCMAEKYVFDLNRTHLDEISTTRPVIVFSFDLYHVWANTLALKNAGVLYPNEAQRKYVPAGEDGSAIGKLYGAEGFGHLLSQMREVGAVLCHRLLDLPLNDTRNVPLLGGPYEGTVKRLVRQAIDSLPHHGITTMRVYGVDREALAILDALNAESEFPVRLHTFFSVHPSDRDNLTSVLISKRMGKTEDKVRCVGARFWLDGRVETQTAYVVNPYHSADDKHGILFWDETDLANVFTVMGTMGLAVSARCVGDAAVEVAYNALSQASKLVSSRVKWWRQIDNAEISGSTEAKLFAEAGIVVSMQPMRAFPTDDWVNYISQRILDERVFAWNAFTAAKAKLAFGSEWPVNKLNVVRAISHLILTRDPFVVNGTNQRISLEASINGYTEIPASALTADVGKLGTLADGYFADLVLVTDDTITVNTVPQVTICDGKITYIRN